MRSAVLLPLLAACLPGAQAFVAGGALARPRPLARGAQQPVHQLQQPVHQLQQRTAPVQMAEDSGKPGWTWIFDIGTKGGVVFWGFVGLVLPFIAYDYMINTMELDIVTAGNVVLIAYVGSATVAWTASYVMRVANKDMTYAKQLKDYEQAVIQKRFDELSEDEVDALMGEIYPAKQSTPE